jgi:hypothetical protein
MYVTDIVKFGGRCSAVQLHMRDALYAVVEEASAAIGLPLDKSYHEDRGDAVFVVAPLDTPAQVLLGEFPAYLQGALRRHNRVTAPTAHLQVRMAVDAGFVRIDNRGVTGHAAIRLFRMLECRAFKDRINRASTDHGLITSTYLYEEIVRAGPGILDPDTFTPIAVKNKETRIKAWTHLPPTL